MRNKKNKKSVVNATLTKLNIRKRTGIAFTIAVFAVIGVATVLFARADSAVIPSDPNTALFLFKKAGGAHDHATDNLSGSDYPTALLYGDGLFICSSTQQGNNYVDSVKQRKLTPAEKDNFVKKIQSLGIEKLNSTYSTDARTQISILTDEYYVNLGDRTKSVLYSSGAKPAELTSIESYVSSFCKSTTETLAATQYELKSIKSTSRSTQQPSLNALIGDTLATLGVNDSLTSIVHDITGANLQNKLLSSTEVTNIKNLLGNKQYGKVKISDQDVDVQLTPLIRPYTVPRIKESLGKLAGDSDSKVLGVSTPNVDFVWFYAADQTPPADAYARISNAANNAASFYQSQVGKSFRVGDIRLQRGKMTRQQYLVCPAGMNCTNYGMQSELLASYYSSYDEYSRNNNITVVLSQITGAGAGACGWGGPTRGEGVVVANISGSAYMTPDCAINHELGHALGSGHICEYGNLMKSQSCGSYTSTPVSYSGLNEMQKSTWANSSPFFGNGNNSPLPGGSTAELRIRRVHNSGSMRTDLPKNTGHITVNGASYTDSPYTQQIGAGSYTVTAPLTATKPATLAILGKPTVYGLMGYTLCSGASSSCSNSIIPSTTATITNASAGSTIILEWHYGYGSPTANQGPTQPTPNPPQSTNSTDTFLKVNLAGGPTSVTMSSQIYPNYSTRHSIGNCTDANYNFAVNGSVTCSGFQIGPVTVRAPQVAGYTFAGWMGCDSTYSTDCYIAKYESGTKNITAKYASNNPAPTKTCSLLAKLLGCKAY